MSKNIYSVEEIQIFELFKQLAGILRSERQLSESPHDKNKLKHKFEKIIAIQLKISSNKNIFSHKRIFLKKLIQGISRSFPLVSPQ